MTLHRSYKHKEQKGPMRLVAFLTIILFIYASKNQSGEFVWEDSSTTTRMLCERTNEMPPVPYETSQLVQQSGFSLAQRQSFGYFDDISDENWKRAQTIHAKMFPNHAARLGEYSNAVIVKDKMKELKMSSFWYAQNFHEEFHCPLAQRVPTNGEGDGPKWVCDPHRLKDKKDCLVYSFGSNGKAEFEKGVKDEIGSHCEIHTFDLRAYSKRNGNFAEALKGLSTFHRWGLGTEEEAQSRPIFYKTLQQTMKELGHENRTIDIFKIDCEWCEWFTYDQWIEQDIRQILVETHNAPMPNAQDFFFKLHDAGFVIFNKEANFQNDGRGVEYGFLKLSTDFFVDGSVYKEPTVQSAR